MLKKMYTRLRYKHKLLLSLILVFILPLLTTSIVFLSKIREAEKENFIRSSEHLFWQSCYSTRLVFDEVHRLHYYLLSNKNIRSAGRTVTVSQKLAICNEINNCMLNSSYLLEIAMYAPSEDKIYFSGGTADSDLYFDEICQFDAFDSDDFQNLTKDLKQVTCLPEQLCRTPASYRPVVTVIMPFFHSYFSAICFTIDAGVFAGFEQDLLTDPSGAFYICYGRQPVYAGNSAGFAPVTEFLAQHESDTPGIITTYEDDDGFFLLYEDANSPLQIAMTSSLTGSRQAAQHISLVWVALLLVLSFIGCLLIAVLWHNNYKPIREVLTYAQPPADEQDINELDRVKHTLISIRQEKTMLDQNLSTSLPAYQKQLLTNLIKGEYTTLEAFNEAARSAGICFPSQHFFVLALSIATLNHDRISNCSHILSGILKASDGAVPQKISLYGFVDQMNEKIIYTGCTDSSETLEEHLLSFHKSLIESFGFELNIGCSNVYEGVRDLDKAYMEALGALDYRIVCGNGKIIWFSQISLANYSHEWYPEELISCFAAALKIKDDEKIHMILDKIMERLQHNNIPVYVAKYVCYDLMRLLADSLTVAQTIPYRKTIGYHNIMNIARLSSFEQITEVLHQNTDLVLSFHSGGQDNVVNSRFRRQLEDFIEENYTDYNFSMNSLVEAFGVSESTMRKTFKSVMQTTFIEYLSGKRIERAKELLVTTRLPLNDIASQVGYLDTSSFIRRFKQKTGMPPGEYRLIHAGEDGFR